MLKNFTLFFFHLLLFITYVKRMDAVKRWKRTNNFWFAVCFQHLVMCVCVCVYFIVFSIFAVFFTLSTFMYKWSCHDFHSITCNISKFINCRTNTLNFFYVLCYCCCWYFHLSSTILYKSAVFKSLDGWCS